MNGCTPHLVGVGDNRIGKEAIEASYDGLTAALFGSGGCRKRLIGRIVHTCLAATLVEEIPTFEEPLLSYRVVMQKAPAELLQALRDLISLVVIQGPRVQHLDFKGQRMVLACFEALVRAVSDQSASYPEFVK